MTLYSKPVAKYLEVPIFLIYFFRPGFFHHFDIDVCIYSTSSFLIVKRILMIMYTVASL